MFCACRTNTAVVDGVCHVCRRPKRLAARVETDEFGTTTGASAILGVDGPERVALLEELLDRQRRAVAAAGRIRAALAQADAGNYSTSALFYVPREDVEALLPFFPTGLDTAAGRV